MRRVGALVAQSSLAFDGRHAGGALCQSDAVTVVAGRLQPTFKDTRAARCALPAGKARNGVVVLTDLVLGGAFHVLQGRPNSTGRRLGSDRVLLDRVQGGECGTEANGPVLALNPCSEGRNCVWAVAEVGRDLGHAVGQVFRPMYKAVAGSTVFTMSSS